MRMYAYSCHNTTAIYVHVICTIRYPELRGVVSLAAVKAILDVPQDTALQQAALRKLFVSYMTAKPAIVRTQVGGTSDNYMYTCIYTYVQLVFITYYYCQPPAEISHLRQ
jgi:hypothetical protein